MDTDRVTTATTAEVTLDIAAPPAVVYRYLTDQDWYPRWMGAAAVLDARPGGRYEISMADGFRAAGRFVSLDPPRQVVFTWGFADDEAAAHTKREPAAAEPQPAAAGAAVMPDGSTRVTVTLDPVDTARQPETGHIWPAPEGVRLTLRHDRLPTPALAAAHQVAWEAYLPRLAAVAAGGDPGPDPHA